MATVASIMTRGVVCVDPDARVATLVQRFEEHGFHHLPVVERGRVVGIVSDRDALREVSPYAGTWGASARDEATLRRRAHQIMSRCPVSVSPGTPIGEAIELILNRRVSCLLVMDEHRKLAGIVTWRDLLEKAFHAHDEDEANDAGAAGTLLLFGDDEAGAEAA